MREIINFTKKYFTTVGLLLVAYVVLSMLVGFVDLSIPYLLGRYVDKLVAANTFSFGLSYMIALTLLSLITIVMGYFVDRLYCKLQVKPAFYLNKDAIEHVQELSVLHPLHKNTAYLNQRINNDANHLIMFSINTLQQILTHCIKFIVPLFLFFRFNIILGFLLLLLNIIYAMAYFLFKKPLFLANFRLSEAVSHVFSGFAEQLSHVSFIQTHGIVPGFSNRLQNTFSPLYKSALAEQRVSYAYSSVDKILLLSANLALFFFGGKSVLDKSMSIGQFTMVLSYFNLMMEATKYFFTIAGDIPQVLVFYERLKGIFEEEKLPNEGKTLDKIRTISLENLAFSYPGGKEIFKNFDYNFYQGKIYCLKGDNGSGKSTLIRIILGLYIKEHEGAIRYNGICSKQINMMELRKKNIAVCEQEPYLLQDSLLYNLTFGEKHKEKDLGLYLDMLVLDRVIGGLRNGLNTRIEQGTENLSGGEKQRVALARTLLKDADLLFLDEPTSALDLEGKERFLKFLPEYKKNKIIIISTHDNDILDISDHILDFKNTPSFDLSS